jgi:hypothetical protein
MVKIIYPIYAMHDFLKNTLVYVIEKKNHPFIIIKPISWAESRVNPE